MPSVAALSHSVSGKSPNNMEAIASLIYRVRILYADSEYTHIIEQ